MRKAHQRSARQGFSLIQISVLLAVGAMLLASSMPGKDAGDSNQKTLDNIYKLDKIEAAMTAFMASNGRRPCPADGQYDVNDQHFGWEAGALTPNSPLLGCRGGDPAAPMGPDIGTGRIVMGTIPTKTLSLPDDYAYDAWGRRFTYVVDVRATTNAACYDMVVNGTQGGVVINTKDVTGAIVTTDNSMYAFVSHGADGHGAWPAQGSSVAGRVNKSLSDADTLLNAGVDASFAYNTTIFTNIRTKKDRTPTFDDLVYYHKDIKNICCIGNACYLANPAAFDAGGLNTNDNTGTQVAMEDINGDGIDDLVVAAPNASPGARANAGAVYVTFGTKDSSSTVDVSSLNGTNGFVVEGAVAGDHLGASVAEGDVNGDNISDLIIGADNAGGTKGEVDVVFGGTGAWPAAVVASNLVGSGGANGANGFRINGINAGDAIGTSVAAGDVNNDDVMDVIVGAPAANTNDGAAYVVLSSKNTWTGRTPVDLTALAGTTGTNGTSGFVIDGISSGGEKAGEAVTAGDLNADGITDVVVSAPQATVSGRVKAGKSYVLFGKVAAWASSVGLNGINGANGFHADGTGADHEAGKAVAVGDINGDGIEDLVLGAPGTNIGAGVRNGSVYTLYGKKAAWATAVDLGTLTAGSTGNRYDGDNGEEAGSSVDAGPDVNGDGVNDMVIGAPKAAPSGRTDAGKAYVIYGSDTDWNSTNDMTTLDGSKGAKIDGAANGEEVGRNVKLGNMKDKAQNEAIVGAPKATVSGNANAGKAYIVSGKTLNANYDLSTMR